MTDPDAATAGQRPESAVWTDTFYAELQGVAQRLFAGERRDHTLQPTAVVHEACLRMLASARLPDIPRAERLARGARVLRQVLIDHQRRHAAEKRGGGALRIELDAELVPAGGPASANGTWIELDRAVEVRPAGTAVNRRRCSGIALRDRASSASWARSRASEP